MAGRRKVDESLVAYFSKQKGKNIDSKLNYEDFWNEVVSDTSFECSCEYRGSSNECVFIIADIETKHHTLTYTFDEVHNSNDPCDIRWNIILHDALTYIKQNKLIKKQKK